MIDGGMLANFPLKYLDNEKMRPMYFSHKRIKKEEDSDNYTVLYGFGLEERSDECEEESQEKDEKNEKSFLSFFSSFFGSSLSSSHSSKFLNSPNIPISHNSFGFPMILGCLN